MSVVNASDKKPVFESSEPVSVVSTFDDLGLKENLLSGIRVYDFEKPSAIQQRAILPILERRDVIAQAQPGTGKTATLAISILQLIDVTVPETQALFLSASRHLATQAQSMVLALGSYMSVQCHACIGGTPIREDKQKFDSVQHVVSGTPGRVLDMIKRKCLKTLNIKILVFDEADVLTRKFNDQIYDIYQHLPPATQVALLSTTFPEDDLETTTKFTTNPIRILVKNNELIPENVRQFFVVVEKEKKKLEALRNLFNTLTITHAMVFCNARRQVDWVTGKLRASDFTVSSMKNEMAEGERDVCMTEFRRGTLRALVTTDGCAGGIDIQQVSLVINYKLPKNRESYIRRIGRAGRFSRKGVVINLVATKEVPFLRDIEQLYDTKIDEMPANIAEILL